MTTVNRNLVQYDIGVKNMAGFVAASAVTVAAGFVEMSATNYTFKNSVASGTTRPMGITTASATKGSDVNEIRTGGYVWQIGVSMVVGSPVYPSDVHGRVQKTGKVDGSGVPYYPGGFGTVVYTTAAATASGYVLTKLQGLV
jgi:hypothetical protein